MGELFQLLEVVMDRNTPEKDHLTEADREVKISETGKVLNIKFEGPTECDKISILRVIYRDISELEIALSQEKIDRIEEIAHKIKNNCNLIEADELKTLAFKIELAARRENQEEASKYALRIKQEFEIYRLLEHEFEGGRG